MVCTPGVIILQDRKLSLLLSRWQCTGASCRSCGVVARVAMPKKRQKLWCQLSKIISTNDGLFGKTYEVKVPGVSKVLTVPQFSISAVSAV